MAGELILIIEDNPLNLKMVDYLLSTKGYKIRTALNAKEALESLAILQPDLILLDLQLPGMDGFELARKLRSEIKYQNMPIIAITAYAMKGDKEKALAAGCNEYFTKPIDTREFPDIIAGYLRSEK